MRPTRREFLWTVSAGSAALALQNTQDVFWSRETVDVGWEEGLEEFRASTCLLCPARCGIRGRMVDGRLVRITGSPLHPMSRGGLCPRGVAGVQLLYHPERLAAPMVRVGPREGGEWQRASREGAIELIAERLRALRAAGRPEALALLSGYCAGTMEDLWRQFLKSYGSPNYVDDAYEDGTDAIMALMHGIRRRPGYDLEQAELVLSFGAPVFEAWWSPLQAFVAFGRPQEVDQRRRQFIQVDTRFSRTAARAHEWVGVRPGTYAALALGIAYVLIRDELFDAEFVANHVSGFEDFTDDQGRRRQGYRSLVSSNFRTEEVSAVTGVPVERITALARAFAQSRTGVAICGTDVTQAPDGLLAGLAVHSLNVIMGNVNRRGGVLLGADPPLAPLPVPELDDVSRAGLAREPIGAAAPPFGVGNRALRVAEAVAGSTDTPVEALFLYYANPLASSLRPEVWRSALEKIPFIVSFSPFLDETTRYADVVLPDLLPYERWQDAPTPPSYPYPVWALAAPLVEPHEGGTHSGDAVLAIARSLGGTVQQSLSFEGFHALLRARAEGLHTARRGAVMGDEFERQHHRQMEERGWWLPPPPDFDRFWDSLVEHGGWNDLFYDDADPAGLARTPDGKIHLMPAELLRLLDTEGQGRTPYVDASPSAATATEFGETTELTLEDTLAREFPLRLIPYRVSTLASGTLALQRWMAEHPTIFSNAQWFPWVEVHPATARALGLSDGTMVWVISPHGRYRARLHVFAGTAQQNVCAPYGMRHPDGEVANPLRVLDGSVDPLTGLDAWSSTFIRLERA